MTVELKSASITAVTLWRTKLRGGGTIIRQKTKALRHESRELERRVTSHTHTHTHTNTERWIMNDTRRGVGRIETGPSRRRGRAGDSTDLQGTIISQLSQTIVSTTSCNVQRCVDNFVPPNTAYTSTNMSVGRRLFVHANHSYSAAPSTSQHVIIIFKFYSCQPCLYTLTSVSEINRENVEIKKKL